MEDNKFKYSVVTVSQALHGCCSGSGDSLSHEQAIEYYTWLNWRLKNWSASTLSTYKVYEDMVKLMAQAALNEYHSSYIEAVLILENQNVQE